MSYRPSPVTARTIRCLALVLWGLGTAPLALAQPQGGDVYREYRWTNTDGDAGGALRVGGKVGYDGGPISLPHDLDLTGAVRVELVLEKLLCHAGTHGLAVSINDHVWIPIPESTGIPAPQWEYQHHIYPLVSVPLAQLHSGSGNTFRLHVAPEHSWNWPQNLIYGVHFRVYYDPAQKTHTVGHLVLPKPSAKIGNTTMLRVAATRSDNDIQQVDFFGLYEGVNLEGDGKYRQWHYHYSRAKLSGHIHTVVESPWEFEWDTSWIPDQPLPFELAARITNRQGVIYQTPPIPGLTFERNGLVVELCKPYDVPQEWVTRSGEHTEKFRVAGDLANAVGAQLVWSSWSPGYMEGLYINDQQVFEREGPRYASYVHQVPLADLSVLRAGENLLRTGKTPKNHGKMVHGMEVNWPGIMVLIQYQK